MRQLSKNEQTEINFDERRPCRQGRAGVRRQPYAAAWGLSGSRQGCAFQAVKVEPIGDPGAQRLSYSSWRRHQMPPVSSLRPLGARSSHWYMPKGHPIRAHRWKRSIQRCSPFSRTVSHGRARPWPSRLEPASGLCSGHSTRLRQLARCSRLVAGRARRWMTPPVPGFTTTLLLPAPLPSD
jgi:hypothetical protein